MTPQFIFANLCADALRCVTALEAGNIDRYKDSLARAYRTLSFLRPLGRPEAYEEGILLCRAVQLVAETKKFKECSDGINQLAAQYSPLLVS